MLRLILKLGSQTNGLWNSIRSRFLIWQLDPYHPLLRTLSSRAPGTYHHSLVVGSLAEAAALRIGADARLVRVGALYHDIGKARWPALFGENGLPSPHNHLAPLTSARYIIRHVADGVSMAQAHRLPAAVQDLIAQHHGTTSVRYFLDKAVAAGQLVSDTLFRYPGPRPQTPEAGILMLADCVEAAVRASQPADQGRIVALVTHLTEMRWAEGELADSGLTRTDLLEIQVAFRELLRSVYHTRPAYPPEVHLPALNHDRRLLPADGSPIAASAGDSSRHLT